MSTYVYCVKERKFTDNIPPFGFRWTTNGRVQLYVRCATCGIIKYRFLGKNDVPEGIVIEDPDTHQLVLKQQLGN